MRLLLITLEHLINSNSILLNLKKYELGKKFLKFNQFIC